MRTLALLALGVAVCTGIVAASVVVSDSSASPVRCVASPSATPSALYAAVDWVCGVEGCGAIQANGSHFYPNTIVAHATYAFDEYYRAHASQGPAACNFGGAGELVNCNVSAAATCNATSEASDSALQEALDWACSQRGVQDCAPIMPGGSHFYPNTTRAHADWAFTTYFRAYRCVPGWHACFFNGTAHVVPPPS